MSTLPNEPLTTDALLQVDRAHRALEKITAEYTAEVDRLNAQLAQRFNPVIFASQSVLYEAMGKAADAGFTYEQLADVMACDQH